MPGGAELFYRPEYHGTLIGAVATSRNFYGVLRVIEYNRGTRFELRSLLNGPIEHGNQFLAPQLQKWPTTYYSPLSGINLTFKNFPRRTSAPGAASQAGGLSHWVVGLGVGSSALLTTSNDRICFYEINPNVINVAQTISAT